MQIIKPSMLQKQMEIKTCPNMMQKYTKITKYQLCNHICYCGTWPVVSLTHSTHICILSEITGDCLVSGLQTIMRTVHCSSCTSQFCSYVFWHVISRRPCYYFSEIEQNNCVKPSVYIVYCILRGSLQWSLGRSGVCTVFTVCLIMKKLCY